MYTLQVCDYDEEKEKKEKQQKNKRYATGFLPRSALCEGIPHKKQQQKDTLPVFYCVLPSVRASRVIRS